MLITQSNLASTYHIVGDNEEALRLRRDIYSRWLRLKGEGDVGTLKEAINYAVSLFSLQRYAEAKALLRKPMRVARRALGENHYLTLNMRLNYARALYQDDDATLDDLREAVTTLEETERTTRRVFGGAHPFVSDLGVHLRYARATLRAREMSQGLGA